MIKPEIIIALEKVYNELNNIDINWVLIGSLSLALQGVDVKPNDIDILTDKKGVYEINNIFKKYEVKKVEYGQIETIRSYFSGYKINDINVEIMGDYEEKHDEKWVSFSNRLEDKNYFETHNLKIPISSLKKQLISYEKSNRPQDILKASKINEFFSKE